MSNCEKCFSPYMDERKKIIFQGKEFCDINCFLASKYFDVDSMDAVVEAREERDNIQDDFDKAKKGLDNLESIRQKIIVSLEALETKYDDKFETGCKELDEILLKITEIKEDGTV